MRSIFAILVGASIAVCSLAADMEVLVPWSEDGALRLDLVLLNDVSNDLNKVQLQLTVSNTSA